MKHLGSFVLMLNFWFFVAVKVAGITFAAWSWWWLLMTPVPTLSLLVKYFGL